MVVPTGRKGPGDRGQYTFLPFQNVISSCAHKIAEPGDGRYDWELRARRPIKLKAVNGIYQIQSSMVDFVSCFFEDVFEAID
jgi:hypothetical protein